jgi:hypothetical protein
MILGEPTKSLDFINCGVHNVGSYPTIDAIETAAREPEAFFLQLFQNVAHDTSLTMISAMMIPSGAPNAPPAANALRWATIRSSPPV